MAEIIMLGTGEATAVHQYNTCFILRTAEASMLVDGGGGNGILAQLDTAKISYHEIDAIFLTHAHTDHILGVVWVLRMIGEMALQGEPMHPCRVFSHNEGISSLVIICRTTLSEKVWAAISRLVEFIEIQDANVIELAAGFKFKSLDLHSHSMKQFGFVAIVDNDIRIACLGDIPCPAGLEPEIHGCDWLMHEAFCPESQREVYHPERIGHCTALEAAEIAQRANVQNLLLYHRADHDAGTTKDDYLKECQRVFSGHVLIPEDQQLIVVSQWNQYW